MDAASEMAQRNLVDSIINLSKQIEDLQQAITGKTQRWGGTTPRDALATTAKALLYDTIKYGDKFGASEWTEKHRQKAILVLQELLEP